MVYDSRESKINDIAIRFSNVLGGHFGRESMLDLDPDTPADRVQAALKALRLVNATAAARKVFDAVPDDEDGWKAYNALLGPLNSQGNFTPDRIRDKIANAERALG